MRCFMSVSSFNSKYDKVMFAYSYSEDSHERASVNNMLECIVQSSADDEMTWQRVRRCVVVQAAHFTLTAQRLQSCVDRTETDCLRRWNDEVATHSGTQTASMKVACNWLVHVHQVTGC